jgi:hypothetical protein
MPSMGDELPGDEGSAGALFVDDGPHYVPTRLTTGPWRPDAMHGGAPSALIGALAIDALEEGEQVARVQIDLEQPVPLEPLLWAVHRRQISRRIAHLHVELSTEAERAVSAKVLLVRTEPIPMVDVDDLPPSRPDQFNPMDWSHLYAGSELTFVRDAIDHRIARGGYGVPEPSAAWLRLKVPVVGGRESSGLSQLLAVADFGSPLSQTNVLGPGLGLINMDVNVTIFRQPVGPWFYLDASGRVGADGVGLSVAHVSDVGGAVGVVTQSQVVRRYQGPGGNRSG